jgi:hypothetical protein
VFSFSYLFPSTDLSSPPCCMTPKTKITQFYDRTFMLDSPERTDIVENYQKDYGEEQQPFMYSVATSIPCSHLILPSCSYRYLSRAVH